MQLDGTIKVAIRIRPLNRNESDHFSAWKLHGTNTIAPCTVDGRPSQYTSPICFDSIFDESAKTTEIYSQIAKEIVEGSMDGINGTIFAYGQTSSGKTHTMQGNASEPGIIPQAITHIFQHIIDSPEREFLLRVSYLEIYNENIRDLLAPEKDNLKVNEDITRGIFVKNLTEEIVSSPQEVAKLMIKGDRNRHVGETNMNERSSRSHTIFRMDIESRDREEGKKGRSSIGGAVKISSLNLVDLAGSERVGHTGAEGIRLKEGGHINKSLLTLGTVIKKLSENGGHIPYRDSRLTRILQPSLGGNARTAIICTITPSNVFMDETVGTLKFASRAKTIKNKPEVNETISDEALLKQYKKEIRDLKEQLDVVKARESQTDLSRTSVSSVNKETDQNALREKLEHMMNMILTGSKLSDTPSVAKKHKVVRRQTWFPGSNAAAYQDDSDDDEGDRNIVSAEIRRPLKRKQNSENIAEDVAGNMETIPITSNPDQNTVAVPTNPDPDPDEIAPLFPPIKYGLNRADCEKMDLLEKLVLKTLCERQEKECEKMAFELAKYKSGMSTTSSQTSPLKTPNRTIKRMRSVSDELDQSPNKQIHLEQVDNESPEVSSNQDTQLRDELSATNSKCEELERKLALQEESAQLKSRSDAEELNSLKEQIREFLSQNANLRDELNASKLQSDELKQKLTIQEETVQMRSRTYVEELNSLKDENKRVHDQNAQLRDELSAVKLLSEELDQKFTSQEEFVRSAAEEVHSLKDQNIKIHDHNAQLRDELSAAKLRSDELEQKLASQEESAQLRLRSDAEALNSLKYQNKESHEQIAQLRDELRASRERSEELERNLSSESVELDSLKIQNNEIHDQNKRLRDELIATKLSQEELKQMLAMQEESALIKSRSDADVLNSMRDELDTAKSKCDELERKLTMQVESSETELRSAAEELNSLKQQNEENMEQNALLRDELEGSKSTCEELERKLRTQEENFEVRSRAEAEEYGTLTKQSDELKNRNVALVDIASVLFSSPDVIPDFENLEELKMSAEQYMSKKVEETKSLESEIQRLQVEIGNFESQLQSLQRSNDELTSTLNSERTRIVELESSVSTLSAVQSDNQRLESKLQTARDDLKTIEEENLILQKDGAETEKLLSAQISALETDVHALEAKLRESSEKLENEATTRKSLIDEISSWKSKWEDLNTSTMEKIELRDKKISELESTIAEMNDAERMLQEAMEEAITVNTNLESQIIELKQKIQDQLTNANSELVGLAGEKGNGESSTLTLELENLRSDLLIANERLDHHSSQEEKYIRTINDLSESMANIENQISSLQKDFSSAIEEKKRFEVLYNDVKKLLEEREQSWQAKYKELELNAAEQENVRQTLSEKEKLLIKSQDFARELREDMKETMAEIVDVEDLLGESEGVVFWKDVLELLRRQFADLNQLKLNENSLRTKLKERESEISELYSSQEKYSGTISKYKEKLHAAMEDKIKLEDKIQAMMVQVEKLNKKRMESIELLNEDIKHEKSENEVLRNELNSKESELMDARERTAVLSTELKKVQESVHTEMECKKAIEKLYDEAKETLQIVNEKLNSSNAKLMEKESELQLLQSKKAEMDEATIQEFQRTKAKLLDYMSQTGKLKAANTRLRFENEELKKRLAEQVDEYKKLLEEKMQDFEEQLKNLEDQALLKDYKIKEDKILIDEKSSIIAKLSRKNSESDDLISAHSQRLKHLEEECRNKDVKISQLTQTNENLGLRNNELIRNYESACKNLEVDSRTLQSELDETCNVLQQKSSECDRLKEEKRNLDLVWASSEKELQQVKAKLSEVVEKLKNVEMESNEKVALLEKELSIKTEHLTKDTKLNMRLKEKDDLIEKLQWTLLQMDNSTEKKQLEEASNAKLHLIKLAGIGNKTLKETTWEELFDALAVTKKKVENQIEEYQNNMSALQEQIESIKLAREQERQRFYQKINEATEKKDINAASSLSIAKSVEIQDAYLADISNDSSEIEQLRRENERLRRTIQTNTIIAKNEQHKYRELESKYSKLEQELELRSVKRRVEENNQQDNVRPSLGKKRTIARILDGRQVEIGTRERVKNKQSE